MITVTFPIQNQITDSYLSLPEPEKALFFDIETTGFQPGQCEVYLIGCAYYKDGAWEGRQWLSESFLDEQRILRDFLSFSDAYDTLIHFNGCMFDVPFLEKTAKSYGMDCHLAEKCQIDLLKIARKCKPFLGLSGLKQKDIETFLGIAREDVFSGGELIEVFSEFKRTGDFRLQKVLLLHNADDVRGMFPLFSLMAYFETAYCLSAIQTAELTCCEDTDTLRGEIALPYDFPKEIRVSCETGADIVFRNGTLVFNLPLVRDSLRSYLPHPENYYYLPEEDMVIHKKLAFQVDEYHRVKAAREQCYVRSDGPFLPACKGCTLPTFRKNYAGKDTFMLLKDVDLLSYLSHLLTGK